MPKINVTTASFKELHQALVHAPAPEAAQSLTLPDIAVLQERLDALAKRWAWVPEPLIFMVLSAAVGMAFAVAVLGVSMFQQSPIPGTTLASLAMAVTFALGGALLRHLVLGSVLHEHFWLTRAIAPLSTSLECEQALDLVESYPECRAYQEAVLANERQFLELDLQAMNALAGRHTSQQQERARTANCRKLHGLPDLAEA